MAAKYSWYAMLSFLLQNNESSPISGLAIPYKYFLLKSLLKTVLALLLQLLFKNYISVLIALSNCL